MKISKLLLPAAAALAALPASAQIQNPGFELGLAGWSESGGSGNFSTPASYDGTYQSIGAAQGSQFGLISNSGVALETISQSFLLPASATGLSLSYRLLTDELNDPAFNDTAYGVLTPQHGSPITLFSVSRNDLQAGGAGGLLPGAAYIGVQTIGHAAWQAVSADISSLAGQFVTLTFGVNNDGDPDLLLDSQLAIDDLQVTAVPEPGSYAAAGACALALWSAWRLRSRSPAASSQHIVHT